MVVVFSFYIVFCLKCGHRFWMWSSVFSKRIWEDTCKKYFDVKDITQMSEWQ